jgi:DNA-binding transcriptional LysR family regulator
MELRQLRAFIEVAESGHFGHAAERLHITQPALTQRIQSLERELGVHLLERNAREVRLAPAGTILLPHARRIVEAEARGLHDLKAYSSGVVGRLHIAYPAGDVAFAGSIIAEYRRRFPAVDVETQSGYSGPNLTLVQNHAADAAFVLMASARPDGITARTIRHEEVIVVMRSDHRLAQMDPVPVKALRGEPVALGAANPDLSAAIQRWLARQTGADVSVVSEDPTDIAMETVVRSGSALLLVVRRHAVMQPVADFAYRSISPALLGEFAIAYRTDDPSPTLANLLRLVDELSPNGHRDVPEDGELI